MSKNKVVRANARPIFETFREIRRGNFLEECADEMQAVVEAVEETGYPVIYGVAP